MNVFVSGAAPATFAVAAGYTAYFVLHRRVQRDRLTLLCCELGVLAPPALAILVFRQGGAPLGPDFALSMVIAVIGAVALLAYIHAASRLPLSLFGLLGYLEPLLLLAASVLIGAKLTVIDTAIYAPILGALALLAIDGLYPKGAQKA